MYNNYTTIGFFDSMGAESVDFILNQTELKTIFTTREYISKLCTMRRDQFAKNLTTIVCFDKTTDEDRASMEKANLRLLHFEEVLKAGSESDAAKVSLPMCGENDCPIFSYTSGTTGDSKGVKLTHKNLISTAVFTNDFLPPMTDPTVVSYLPYPHSFEQILSFMAVIYRYRIGYYQGDPSKLTEDCQILKPTFFPSVPRLYNKIYQKLQDAVKNASGVKGCLVNMALNSKLRATNRTGATTNCCYDAIVF